MPEKDEYLYMDDGGHGITVDVTPELEESIKNIDEKVKERFPFLNLGEE